MYKMFVGSGGFSEYYNNKGKLAIGPFTNMEFINNGDFIGVDNANLKFIKYVYNDGYFNIAPLNEKYIQTLFPDPAAPEKRCSLYADFIISLL